MDIESELLQYTGELHGELSDEETRQDNLNKKNLPKKGIRSVYARVMEPLLENKKRYEDFLLHINGCIENIRICQEKIKDHEILERLPLVEPQAGTELDVIILERILLLKDSFRPSDSTEIDKSLLATINKCMVHLQESKKIIKKLLRMLDKRIEKINNQKIGTLEGNLRERIAISREKKNIKPASEEEAEPDPFVNVAEEILKQPYNESDHIKSKGGKTHKKKVRKQMPKKKTFRKR